MASVLTIAVVRSGFLYRVRPARALAVELGLAVIGLLVARWLLGDGPFVVAFSVWGFFLVESTYFLLGAPHERPRRTPDVDPFEQAARRAHEILGSAGP